MFWLAISSKACRSSIINFPLRVAINWDTPNFGQTQLPSRHTQFAIRSMFGWGTLTQHTNGPGSSGLPGWFPWHVYWAAWGAGFDPGQDCIRVLRRQMPTISISLHTSTTFIAILPVIPLGRRLSTDYAGGQLLMMMVVMLVMRMPMSMPTRTWFVTPISDYDVEHVHVNCLYHFHPFPCCFVCFLVAVHHFPVLRHDQILTPYDCSGNLKSWCGHSGDLMLYTKGLL